MYSDSRMPSIILSTFIILLVAVSTGAVSADPGPRSREPLGHRPAPVEKTLYLEDLGYSRDLYLSGAVPEVSFYLPNHKGLKKLEANIDIRFSGVLDTASTITVLADDVPIFTKSLSKTGYESTLSFSLPAFKADYLKITLRGHLFITGDICVDTPTGNLWMVISNRSSFIGVVEGRKENIADFFGNYDKEFHIAYDHGKSGIDILALVYYLKKLNDWKKVSISVSDKQVEGVRNIIVGEYENDLEIKNSNLYVSWKGVPLLKKSLADLYITSALRSSSVYPGEAKKTKELSFRDAGIKNTTLTGIGDLYFTVPLKYTLFSGIPKNLHLNLMLNHSPVSKEDRAYLKFFLNGTLLKAVQLESGGGTNSYDIDLREDFLKGYDNSLNVVVSYYINRGECRGSFPKLTASMLDTSYFYYDASNKSKIHTVRDTMGSLSGDVLVMIDGSNMMGYGIRLMDLLSSFNGDISNVNVQPWKGEIPGGSDYVILLLNPDSTKNLRLPLQLHKKRFSILNPLTQKDVFNTELKRFKPGQEVFGSEYVDGFGVFQTFDEKNSKVLLMSYYKDISSLDYLNKIGQKEISKLLGNVVMFNQDMASYDIGEKYRVIYMDDKSIGYYWNKYKLLIILTGGLIIVAFLFYINKKLVRGRE